MIEIAINVLWFLIGLIILAGIIYLAIWVIETFIHAIPERVKQGVWVVVLLLALIALLSMLVGGGNLRMPKLGGKVSDFPAIGAPVKPAPNIMIGS